MKGVVTRAVVSAIVEAARARSIPVLVDPKVPHIDRYAGATVVTPNDHEAEAATLLRIRTGDEAAAAARAFRDRVSAEHVLITRGEHGMWLLEGDRDHELAAVAREVSDVTGAGDTVIATLALGIAAGAPLAGSRTPRQPRRRHRRRQVRPGISQSAGTDKGRQIAIYGKMSV